MSYHPINVPWRYPGETTYRIDTMHGETVAGLYIHPDRNGYGWVVANRMTLKIATVPTRARAREVARILSPLMPEPVKAGRWDGNRWLKEDPAAANAFRETVRRVT